MDRTGKKLTLILALMLLVFLSAMYTKGAMYSEHASSYRLAENIGDWQSQEVQTNMDMLRAELGAQSILFRSYSKPGGSITLYLAYYKDVDSANRVHAPTVCYPGQGWTVVEDTVIDQTTDGRRAGINRLVIEKGKARELVYNWWQTGDAIFPKNSTNRFYQMYRSVAGEDPSTVWVRLSIDLSDSAHAREADLAQLTGALMPLIEGYFTQ